MLFAMSLGTLTPGGLNRAGKLDWAGEEVSTAATGEQEEIRECAVTSG